MNNNEIKNSTQYKEHEQMKLLLYMYDMDNY